FRDITERKRTQEALRASEERLRRFYESDMFGVFYWNLNGAIVGANNKFLAMVGHSQEDVAAGRLDWVKMTPPEFRKIDEFITEELRSAGLNRHPYEKEYIRSDGTRVPVLYAGAMLDKDK